MKLLIPFLLAATALLTGCIGAQSFPMVARAGDTVILTVGSPEGMTFGGGGNTTATFTPDGGGGPYALTIREKFDIYPDKRSSAWRNSGIIESNSGHGPWTTNLVIDLPAGLPTGPGKIDVSTTATYPLGSQDVNGKDIDLVIVAGTGSPTTFEHYDQGGSRVVGDFNELAPRPRLEVQTDSLTGGPYGAIEITVTLPNLSLAGIAIQDMYVVVDEKVSALDEGISHSWYRNGDDVVVTFLSTKGVLDPGYARFAFISDGMISFPGVVVPGSITGSVKYLDINGVVTTGPGLVLDTTNVPI